MLFPRVCVCVVIFQRSGADFLTGTFGESCVSQTRGWERSVLPCCFSPAPSSAPNSATVVSGQITSHVIADLQRFTSFTGKRRCARRRVVHALRHRRRKSSSSPWLHCPSPPWRHHEVLANHWRHGHQYVGERISPCQDITGCWVRSPNSPSHPQQMMSRLKVLTKYYD